MAVDDDDDDDASAKNVCVMRETLNRTVSNNAAA